MYNSYSHHVLFYTILSQEFLGPANCTVTKTFALCFHIEKITHKGCSVNECSIPCVTSE